MKHLVKAALAASALLAAGHANAATYVFGANAAVDQNFYQTGGSQAAGFITAVLSGNGPTANAPFSDTFIFAVPWDAALGSGSATASLTNINLDFSHTGADATGLVLTGYNLSPAGFTALQKLYLGTGTAADLTTVTNLMTAGNQSLAPMDGVYDSAGGTSHVHLDNVGLSNTSFYAFTISGTSVAAGGSYGGQLSATAVPEPATWAMLLVGFGAVGFAMRRRSEQSVKVSFA